MRPRFITTVASATLVALLGFATLNTTTASADQSDVHADADADLDLDLDLDAKASAAAKPSSTLLNLELSFLSVDGDTAPLFGSNLSFRANRFLDFRLGLHLLAIWPVADAGVSVFFKRGAVAPYATARISHLGLGAVGAGVELGGGRTVFTLEADVLTVADESPIILTSLGMGFRL
ncbi:MAG: hypothetical protein IT370_09790 [Deltaproteobacteria bacterium]|nr:hypothetical protein [Deltaproteobacteria bacterium]